MIIKTIRYERLHSFGNYENERLTAEAEVLEGEDPVQVRNQLVAFVESQITGLKEVRGLEETKADLQYSVQQLERDEQALQARVEQLRQDRNALTGEFEDPEDL